MELLAILLDSHMMYHSYTCELLYAFVFHICEILLLMSYSVFTKHSEQYVGDIKSLSHTGLIHISDVNIVCEDQND